MGLLFSGVRQNLFLNILAWTLVNPGESHPEQRGHGSPRESRGERCEDRKGFPRWGKINLRLEWDVSRILFLLKAGVVIYLTP